MAIGPDFSLMYGGTQSNPRVTGGKAEAGRGQIMKLRKLRHGLALVLMLGLAACGTIEGFGRDLSGAANRTSRLF